MNIPQLQEDRTYSRSVGAFLGYNVNPEIGNGENHDEYNLTADEYPLLANRRAQSKLYTTYFSATNDVLGSLVKDNVLYVIRSNGKLYHWGESGGTWQWIEASSTNAPTFAEKQKMVSVGAKICFYPKLYSYNTTNDT